VETTLGQANGGGRDVVHDKWRGRTKELCQKEPRAHSLDLDSTVERTLQLMKIKKSTENV
jgi:hypothetical protein